MEPTVTVVICTYQMRDALLTCLKSVRDEANCEWQIVVVVNGDSDGTASTVAKTFPEVELLVNASNRGVAPARIQGLALARGDVVILLDADTVVSPGALRGLVATLLANPQAGLVGPRLVAPDGRPQLTARSFPTILTKARRRVPDWLTPLLPKDNSPDSDEPTEVDYVIGACQVIRRPALEAVGGLDPVIFYGPEDVDLCLRLWKGGWTVLWDPRQSVMHHEQRTTRRSMFSLLTLRHVIGLTYFFAKHRYLLRGPQVRHHG
jgi:hypothetical protein